MYKLYLILCNIFADAGKFKHLVMKLYNDCFNSLEKITLKYSIDKRKAKCVEGFVTSVVGKIQWRRWVKETWFETLFFTYWSRKDTCDWSYSWKCSIHLCFCFWMLLNSMKPSEKCLEWFLEDVRVCSILFWGYNGNNSH